MKGKYLPEIILFTCFALLLSTTLVNAGEVYQNTHSMLPTATITPNTNQPTRLLCPTPKVLVSLNTSKKQSFADSLIRYAKRYLGTRYQSGGYSSKGFDCSGFTAYVFSQFGLKLPHSSRSQATLSKPVDRSKVQKGDLIFFKSQHAHRPSVGHVGIVISNPGEKIFFIHASLHKGITVDAMDSAYYKSRYLAVGRLTATTRDE
jgi:murein DD-endopeptidase / murein LD-carboxypeptidase